MSQINNYEELMEERRRLEFRIVEHKKNLSSGLQEFKEKLEPFLNLLPILNIFKKKHGNSHEGNTNSIWKLMTSLGIDLLVGQNLLSKANWFTRLLVPLFLKGISARALRVSKDSPPAQALPENINGAKR